MPIALQVPLRRLSQREFGEIAFEVMRHVFAIHHEIGRFFDETIFCDLAHGKLINVRPRDVQHDFVNTHWLLQDHGIERTARTFRRTRTPAIGSYRSARDRMGECQHERGDLHDAGTLKRNQTRKSGAANRTQKNRGQKNKTSFAASFGSPAWIWQNPKHSSSKVAFPFPSFPCIPPRKEYHRIALSNLY
jgi:hypothetical protein